MLFDREIKAHLKILIRWIYGQQEAIYIGPGRSTQKNNQNAQITDLQQLFSSFVLPITAFAPKSSGLRLSQITRFGMQF